MTTSEYRRNNIRQLQERTENDRRRVENTEENLYRERDRVRRQQDESFLTAAQQLERNRQQRALDRAHDYGTSFEGEMARERRDALAFDMSTIRGNGRLVFAGVTEGIEPIRAGVYERTNLRQAEYASDAEFQSWLGDPRQVNPTTWRLAQEPPNFQHIPGGTYTRERPDMAVFFPRPTVTEQAYADLAAVAQHDAANRPRAQPAPGMANTAGVQASNPASEVHMPAAVPAQATVQAIIDAIKEDANAEDPNSDEAKRKQIEQRLQEIRATAGAQFGDVLMQSINLYPTHVEATVGGVRKTIAIMDFKQILDGFIKSDTKIENMQMPYGTFLFGRANGEIQISCYYPARRATLKHVNGYDGSPKEFNVPLPNVIISHKLKQTGTEWQVLDSHYFCTDRKVTSLPEGEFIWQHDARKGIYIMPFTNFYPEGRMCFGNNSVPKRMTNNLNGLDYYYKIIEIAPFNNDLGIRSVRGIDDPRSWFKTMSEMTEFDYSKLTGYVPYTNTATMASAGTASPATEATQAPAAPATPVRRNRPL